jgi:hypothetical protein
VIYDHPTDFPDSFVARRHIAYGPDAGPTAEVMRSNSLNALQEEMERRGLIRLDRYAADAPCIVETWL